MAIFEAYFSPAAQEQPTEAGAGKPDLQLDRLDTFRMIKTGKSFLALIFPALWLLFNKLWFEFLVYLIFAVAIAVIGSGNWAGIAPILSVLPGVFLFLEGNKLVAAKHERMGWKLAGVIEADSLESAEMRFVSHWLETPRPDKNAIPAPQKRPAPPRQSSADEDTGFGLFPES